MVRQRPLVIPRRFRMVLGVALALNLFGFVLAEDPKKEEAPPAPPPAKAETKKAPVAPIDLQPYKIKVVLSVDPVTRIDRARLDILLFDWTLLVHRFVGNPWSITLALDDPLRALAAHPDDLRAASFASAGEGFDKVWTIHIQPDGSGLVYSGREYDVSTGRLGPLQRRRAPVVRDAARVLFHFARDLFSPSAEIGDRFGKDVSLIVRGASIPPASPIGQVVAPGTIFEPLRVVPQKKGAPIIRGIPYTFLHAEAAQAAGARCSVVSVYSDPFTKRVVQKTSLVALGVKPGKSPTRLRFLTMPDKAPAAGYVLIVRNYPNGTPREVGTTDRQGRITLDASDADGLLVLRLLAGSSEPMIEFPLIPGEDEEEQTIPPFDPKPLTVALETRLDSLRDSVIDLVAVRARLEARLKARFDGEDWAGLETTLKEYAALTPRSKYADELNTLRDEAAKQQAKARVGILTRTAQAQLADLQALIDRYLDDETYKTYQDGLEQYKAIEKSKAAAAAKKKLAARPK